MSGGRDWTTGEVRRLHEMRCQRVPVKDIANALRRTPDAIYSYLRYVPARPGKPACLKPTERVHIWTHAEIERLRDLAADGATALEAARALNRTPTAVRSMGSRESIRFTGRGKHTVFRVERESDKYRRDAVEGSHALLDAMLRMVA